VLPFVLTEGHQQLLVIAFGMLYTTYSGNPYNTSIWPYRMVTHAWTLQVKWCGHDKYYVLICTKSIYWLFTISSWGKAN